MKILEASPGALIRGERKSMARRVKDIYSKLKMTYDYLCLVRRARNFRGVQTPKDKRQDSANSPNFLGTQTQILVPRRGPASLNVPCARRNSRDIARQTCTWHPSASHTLLYCPTYQHRYVVPRPAHCSHGSLVHNATIDHRSPSSGSGT